MRHQVLNFKVAFCTAIFFMCSSLSQSINVNSKHVAHTNKKIHSNGLALLAETGLTMDDDDDDDDEEDDKNESDFDYDQVSSGSDFDQFGDDFDNKNNALPFFKSVPDNAYIFKGRHASLKCKAIHALDLVFQCLNDTKTNPPTNRDSHVNPQSGVPTIEATAEISLAYFEQFFVTPFHCECVARNAHGEVKSRSATITLAHIERNFIMSPPSARIEPGNSLEIKCTLPSATPPAVRSWLKNGQKIDSSSQVTITQDGKLIIHSAKVSDSGNYSCVAKNIVAKKISNPVPVIVRSEKRWSEWSACNIDCLKFRTRNCNSKSPDDCHGKEVETAECKDGSCEEKIAESSDKIIYFTLIIVSLLCVVLAALFAHAKRKKPEIPDYIVTDNEILEIQPKSYEGEKRYRQQLQSSKKSSYTYEYNTMAPEYNPPPAFPKRHPNNNYHENHYHEPQLAITYSVPFDKISSKISNSNTSSTRKLQSDTISSSTETLNSTQVIEMESSSTTSLLNDKNQQKSNMIEQMVTSNGGWLELEHLETSLSIPELTFERTRKYNIFLTVLHNEFIKNQITSNNFNDNSTHLSSIIYCGPSDVLLNKPVILKFPHCANHFENWNISLLHNSCVNDSQKAYIEMDEDKDRWKRIASTSNDVINPLAFIQLDSKNAFIISRVLGKLLLVGESKTPEVAVEKRMKIALFGPKHKMPSGDFNVRIYIVEDYRSSIDYCTIIEKNLGNDLLMLSKDFLFKDNKEDLWVSLVCSGGWVTRNESQKIPYSHLWKNSYLLHCDFMLEKDQNFYNVNKLNMEIFVKQKHGDDIFLNNLLLYN